MNKAKDLRTKAAKRSLRLAVIVSERAICEYTVLLEHLLVGLADESIPVALVCPPGSDVDSIVSGAAEVIRYPSLQLPLMEHVNRKRLIEQLTRFEPTLLHCLCESKASLSRRLARQLDLPYVLSVNSLRKRWGEFFISSKRCARIMVPAKSIAANVTSAYPRFADRIVQINIGTFVAEGSRCFSGPGRLSSLVTAHPLDNVSDFENLFNAARHLTIDGYEFMMLVLGSGRGESQMRKLLTALGLWQNVSMVPILRPWRPALAAGDIFIVPQPSDAFNPFLLEAMSVGMAVAGCEGGVDDLIIQDRTAAVFDPQDELSIYGCLQRLLSRKEFARQLAKEAQQYVRDNHSVSNMISATLRVYHQAEQWLKR